MGWGDLVDPYHYGGEYEQQLNSPTDMWVPPRRRELDPVVLTGATKNHPPGAAITSLIPGDPDTSDAHIATVEGSGRSSLHPKADTLPNSPAAAYRIVSNPTFVIEREREKI